MSDDFFLRDGGGGGEVSTSCSDTDFSVMWPATCTLLFDEVHSLKTTTGLQLAVRHKSASLNVAMGKAVTPPRGDTPMTPDTLCDWQSTTKAITAIAVAVAHEKRIVDVFQPVATYWPEFRKHDVTLAHCLTHVAGLAFAGIRLVPEHSTKEDICAAIADAQPEHEPGEKACYHPYSGCYIVAECVERASGVPWSDFVRENVLEPLGVADNILLCFPTEDAFTAFKPRLAELVSRPDDTLSYADVMNHPCPASGMRATAGAVADVMACLARGGTPILKTDTLMMFTRRHRIGMLDELQGVVVDWSLGFAVDSALGGTFASSESYGHGGSQSSYALVDPEHSLSLAFAATNKPGARVHYDRVRRISDAIYKDLRLNATRHARAAPVC